MPLAGPASTFARGGPCSPPTATPACVRSRSSGPAERSPRSRPTSCSSPAAGTPSPSSGAASAAGCDATSRGHASCPRCGPPWLSVIGAAAGEVPTSVPYWSSPADDLSEHFVELQRDSTVADVLDAVGHELRSTEHVKRATYIGTAIDQGRTSGALAAAIVNEAWGAGPGAQGPTNAARPTPPCPTRCSPEPTEGPRCSIRCARRRCTEAPRRARRGVRERRPVAPPVVLPGCGRVDAGGRGTGVPRGAPPGRRDGRLDPGQDRARRARCGDLPRPALHEPHVDARRRVDPLRAHARARRHGVRRRRRDATGRGPFPHHDHHRRRREGDGPRRGMAADRVARPARVRDERDRAVGDDRRERSRRARRARRRRHRPRPGRGGLPVHDLARERRGGHAVPGRRV